MPLSAGTRLGPYEIVSPLGAGGMGEVYKARDTRLDRWVAVKVSAEQFSERFAREARAVAALNHPNIVALYDVGDNYIVTELVEGESLRTAQLTARKAVDIAAQVAEGLAAAHAAGIVHRDLKPENLMITRDGRAKILDFGLSRRHDAAGAADATRTLPGTVMGTAGYMSPEQVRGQEADYRSDIFSFGVVLYELLAGQRAFRADTAAEVMTAILKQDPPELPPTVSAPLREIVRHCMEKEPAARFQSAKDLAFALRALLGQSTSTQAASAIPDARRTRRWWFSAVGTAGLAAAFLIGRSTSRTAPPDLANYRFTPIASEGGPELWPAWSPDGKTLAYSAAVGTYLQIFTRRLDAPVADQITREEGSCSMPFWSKDGQRIFYSKPHGGLWSIAAVGGAPQHVLDQAGVVAVASDGVSMALARETGKSELAFGKLGGSEWKPYKKPPFDQDFSGRFLQFSPDGTKLAVLFSRTNSGEGEVWEVPYPPERGSPRKLFSQMPKGVTVMGFGWMPNSRDLVLSLTRALGTEQLYLGNSETGGLRQLTTGMVGRTAPAVSPDGRRIAFVEQMPDSDLVEIMLDPAGLRPVLATARSERSGSWYRSGREFLYTSDVNGHWEPWVRNAEENRARPLLPNASEVLPPGSAEYVWMAPDAQRFAIEMWGAEHTIWVLRPSGGKAVRIDPGNADHHSASWSPDGNWIAYGRVRPKEQLMKVPAGGGEPVALATLEWQGGPTAVAWSPTGEWIAWSADTLTLYSPDGRQQKKLGEGRPRQVVGFSRDGKTLYAYYVERRRGKWIIDAYDVASGKSRRIGELELDATARLQGFGLHPDGKRFLASLDKSNPDIVLLEGF